MTSQSNVQILIVPPGLLSDAAKSDIVARGVVCIETSDPDKVKLLQAGAMPVDDLLLAALRAITTDSFSGNVADKFPKILCQLLEAARKPKRDEHGRFLPGSQKVPQ